MAVNLLTITKEANDYFTFVLNGDTVNSIKNTRNDLTMVGDYAHIKSSNGANLISQQNVIYSNITIIDGATTLIPTSPDDLFAKLISVNYFDWINGSGGGGVDRFEDLLDTFNYSLQENKAVFVNASATGLEPRTLTLVTVSTQLSDMPSSPVQDQILIRNSANDAYIQIPVPAGANGYNQEFIYNTGDPVDFVLGTNASLSLVFLNGYPLKKDTDWSQAGNILTILPTVTLVQDDQIVAVGVI